MEILTSVKNPRVAFWRSLKDRKGRKESGCFLVEGEKMVREALDSAFPVQSLILREGHPVPEGLNEKLPVFCLPERVFSSVSETVSPQGIAAVVQARPSPAAGTRLLALNAVQDPGNVGTMIRTADAAGLSGILLDGACADVFSPKVLRSTMGSIFRVGLSFVPSLPETLADLRSRGWTVISSRLDGSPFYERREIREPWVLIIGNEGNGIADEVDREATDHFRLPMRGGAESLNAAVAAGIMMYDLIK